MTIDLREQSEEMMRGGVRSAATVLSFCSGVLLTVSDRIRTEAPHRYETVPPEATEFGPTDPVELDSFLGRFFQTERVGTDFSSATFVLVREGRLFLQKSYGMAPVEEGTRGMASACGVLLDSAGQVGRLLSAMIATGREGLRRAGQELPGMRMFRQHFTQHPEAPDAVFDLLETYTHRQRALIHTGGSGARSLIYLLPDQYLGFFLVIRGADPKTSFRIRTRLVQKFLDRYYPLGD